VANREYVRRNLALARLQSLFYPSLGFVLGVGSLLVLWLGSGDVMRGRLSVGEFVAFNAYLTMLTWPMIAFGWVTNMIQRGTASWKRMLEVMDTEPLVADAPSGPASPCASGIRGEIEVRNLTFGYGGQPVLHEVSLRVGAGETLAIVGPTGSGKTTLINLLPRLHEPPRGTVFIDGTDVRDLTLPRLRGAIGFVSQEPFLFSESLAGNVAFGAAVHETGAGPGRDAVVRAAAVARLDKDVQDFPNGYDTTVGERGITLSGGQKQRTALARALMVDPRILILDGALSAVDTDTEEEILSRLRGVMRQRTSVIVSHRISTVRDADQIIVLTAGRIIERGTHADLVALDGAYAEMYRRQLLEDELAVEE